MIRIVIEDRAMVFGAIASLLAFEGDMTIVGRALDGDTALALVRDLTPDILLTDIEMPWRSAIDIAAALSTANLATRVVIVTTFARPGYRAHDRPGCATIYRRTRRSNNSPPRSGPSMAAAG